MFKERVKKDVNLAIQTLDHAIAKIKVDTARSRNPFFRFSARTTRLTAEAIKKPIEVVAHLTGGRRPLSQ